jgi:hypothetical protein
MQRPCVQLPQDVRSLHGGLHVDPWSGGSNGEKFFSSGIMMIWNRV